MRPVWARWCEWWAGCRLCGALRGRRRNGVCADCAQIIAKWHAEQGEFLTTTLPDRVESSLIVLTRLAARK